MKTKSILFAVGGGVLAYFLIKKFTKPDVITREIVRDASPIESVPQMNPYAKMPPPGYRPAYGYSALPLYARYTGRIERRAAPFASISHDQRFFAEIVNADGTRDWLMVEKTT